MHQRWKDIEPTMLNTPDPKPRAPEHPHIDWVDWADWIHEATSKLKRKLGDRTSKLPAVLTLPEWWRKEFGGRWEWIPAIWSRLPKELPKAPDNWRELSIQDLNLIPELPSPLIADWAIPWIEIVEKLRAPFLDDLSRYRKEPVRWRRPSYELMSRSLRTKGTEVHKGANAGLNHGAIDERFMSFNSMSAFDNLKTLESFLKQKSCALIYADLDRLEHALSVLIPQAAPADSRIYDTTQIIAVGSFQTASTSSVLAQSTRWLGDPRTDAAIAEFENWKRKPKPMHWKWKDWSNRRKQLWGWDDSETNNDFHDRAWSACASNEPIDNKPSEELKAKFRAHAADIESKRNEYAAYVDIAEKKTNWALKPSKALMALWNEQLKTASEEVENSFTKDKKLGLERTGLEELANEELRSLKYRKSRAIPRYKNELVSDLYKDEEDEGAVELPDEDEIPDEDVDVSDIEDIEPEDDDADVDYDNEKPQSFYEPGPEASEGTCYINDPRFSDDEDAVGPPEGHEHIIPSYEDNTRATKDPYTHDELEAVRGYVKGVDKKSEQARRIPIVIEMIYHNRTPEEALEIHNDSETKPKTAQKWKERFVEAAMIFKDRPNGMPDVELTDEMLDDIKEGAAYVLLDLGNGWKYHQLDTATYDDLDAAVQALKEDKILSAWKESTVRKKTQKDFIGRKVVRRIELQRIREKFDARFMKRWVLRDPNQWPKSRHYRGLLGDLASREAQE